MTNTNTPTIICTCGNNCSAHGRVVVPYTMWVNNLLIESRYVRTCPKCDTIGKRRELEAQGYTLLKEYGPQPEGSRQEAVTSATP